MEINDRTVYDTDDRVILCMSFACCINNATDTESESVIFLGFRRQQWLRERASLLLRHVHYLRCYNLLK
jgi:hypothetical protein